MSPNPVKGYLYRASFDGDETTEGHDGPVAAVCDDCLTLDRWPGRWPAGCFLYWEGIEERHQCFFCGEVITEETALKHYGIPEYQEEG